MKIKNCNVKLILDSILSSFSKLDNKTMNRPSQLSSSDSNSCLIYECLTTTNEPTKKGNSMSYPLPPHSQPLRFLISQISQMHEAIYSISLPVVLLNQLVTSVFNGALPFRFPIINMIKRERPLFINNLFRLLHTDLPPLR